jgi:hypothetical protein
MDWSIEIMFALILMMLLLASVLMNIGQWADHSATWDRLQSLQEENNDLVETTVHHQIRDTNIHQHCKELRQRVEELAKEIEYD